MTCIFKNSQAFEDIINALLPVFIVKSHKSTSYHVNREKAMLRNPKSQHLDIAVSTYLYGRLPDLHDYDAGTLFLLVEHQ